MVFNSAAMKNSLFLILFFVWLCVLNCQAQSLDGLVVIGNHTGLNSVSRKELRNIFKGNQSLWPNREQITVVMPSAKSEYGLDFSNTVLDLSYPMLQKYWLGLVFQGRAAAPVFLNSSSEILDYVKRNPGAISVVKLPEREIGSEWIIPLSER